MYILATLTDTDYQFQLKSQDGIDIGYPYVYSIATHRIFGFKPNEWSQNNWIVVQLIENGINHIPPVATFPKSMIVFIDMRTTPAPDAPITVTFDANGGAEPDYYQMEWYAAPLFSNTFTYSRYHFDHWNTQPDNSGTSYDNMEVFPFSADTTLYAIWAPDV
jgi:hypothetical protein